MKLKFKRATAQVNSVSSTVCIFLAVFCSTVSSVDLPSHLNTSEVHKTQDGRDFLSSRTRESMSLSASLLKRTTPATFQAPLKKITTSKTLTNCSLEADLLQQLKSPSGFEWIINNEALKILGKDPQKLIQCTESGDRVIFNLSGVQKFERTMVVFHELELINEPSEIAKTEIEYRSSVSFTCPDVGPFLIVNATNFAANGLIVENCTESSSYITVVVKQRSSAVFEDVEINNNNRAIYVESHSVVAIENSHFNNSGRSSLRRGVIFVASNVSLKISDSSFLGNKGYWGGVLFANAHNVIAITENHAEWRGGAIYLQFNSNLNVENSTMSQNNADYGGAIRLHKSNDLTIINSKLRGNEASESGGAISSGDNNNATILNSSFTRNKATYRGGAIMLGIDCPINMTNSSMKGNDAKWGGGMFLESGVVAIVSSTHFSSNSASRGGGIYVSMECDIYIKESNFTKNHAEFGGCFYGVTSSSKVQYSNLWNNSASQSGGCFFFESYTAKFEANTFNLNQAKKDGGAIYASSKTILRLEEDHVISNSALNGGGIALISDSRILCESGTFGKNIANRGGGVYVESQMTQIVIAQFGESTFLNNNASQYGGGIAIKTFGSRSFDCKRAIEPCSHVLLIATSFVGNIANHSGSAVLATTPKNVLIACEAWFWFDPSRFIRVSDIQELQSDYLLATVTSSSSPCESWKDNKLASGAYERVIGTFGQKISITSNSMDGSHITGDYYLGYSLYNVTSGKELPTTLTTIDAFGNEHAPALHSDALVLSNYDGFLGQSIGLSLENDACVMSNIISLVKPGNYSLQMKPRYNDDTLVETNLTIVVRNCTINEVSTWEGKLCLKCSEASYNFDLSREEACMHCLENANCSTRYIKPIDGYWHKSPCHAKVKKCIVGKACQYQKRIEELTDFTQNQTDCGFNTTKLEEYEQIQCAKGYQGPLCGSCEKLYGLLSSFECAKCGHVLTTILTLIAITFYLLFGTSITIKGILPLSSQQPKSEDTKTPITEASTSILKDTRNHQPRETNEGSNNFSHEGTSTSSYSQQQEHSITMAKQRIIETWKILLNFLQVTSTAATLDVEWTYEVLNTMEKCQVFGAATINSVSQPLDCLLSCTSRATRVICQTLFSIFIPTTVIAILAIYWGYRAIVVHCGDGSYFLKRFVLTTITTTYLTYFELTQVAVRVFNCVVVHDYIDPISKSFTRFWMADTSIECYKSTHIVLIGISLVVLIVISIGFPLLCSFALYVKKNEVNTINSWAHDTLSFLCGPFKQRFVYWECVTMIKKALLSIIIVFSYSLGNQAQGLLILIVLGFFLYLHMLCYPYDEAFRSLNYYEGGSLLTSCTVYTIVQFLSVETLSEFNRHAVSFCLIVITSLFVCVMVYKILSNVIRLLRAIRESRNVRIGEHVTWFSILKIYYKNRKEIHSSA